MSRADKLKQLDEQKAMKGMVIFSDGQALTEALTSQFTRFKEMLGDGVDINADELLGQLEKVSELSKDVQALKKSIEDLDIPAIPDSVDIKGLEELIQATDKLANKKEITVEKVDTTAFTKLNKQMDKLIKKIEGQAVTKLPQQAEDFVPMRRVIKVGNKLIYDDAYYSSGGSGGSIPTINGSVPVVNPDGSEISGGSGGGGGAVTIADGADVALGAKADSSASSDTGTFSLIALFKRLLEKITTLNAKDFATTAKQDTIIGHVDGIETLIGTTNTNTSNTASNTSTLAGAVASSRVNTNVQGDVAAASADSGNPVKVGGKYNSTQPTYTDGQRGDVQIDSRGNTRTAIYANNTNTTLDFKADDSDGVATSSTANKLSALARNVVFNGSTWDRLRGNTTGVQNIGGLAHDAADTSANQPTKVGGYAITSLPTAVANADVVNNVADKYGRQVMIPGIIRDLVGTQTTTISASTSETTIFTAAASVYNDLTALVISNTSGTAARVDFRDTTAGSVLFSIYVPAGDVRGVAFNRPIPQTSVNTNWTAQSSASITDLRIYAVADKNR